MGSSDDVHSGLADQVNQSKRPRAAVSSLTSERSARAFGRNGRGWDRAPLLNRRVFGSEVAPG
jgi:hypothetical protein